jgi:hypothetical protein
MTGGQRSKEIGRDQTKMIKMEDKSGQKRGRNTHEADRQTKDKDDTRADRETNTGDRRRTRAV